MDQEQDGKELGMNFGSNGKASKKVLMEGTYRIYWEGIYGIN